jgi:hypothetical protein
MKAPDHGLELARRFHAAMQGIPYLGAIIPACVDADGVAWLQSRPDGLTAALHGWDHYPPGGVRSEFHNCNLDGARALLERGRHHLGLGDLAHFVPPFNAVEEVLPEACYLEGLHYIWGGGSHGVAQPSDWATQPPPYPLGRVTFVPSWAPTYGATRWRMSAEGPPPLLETLPALLEREGCAVVTLHICWEAAHDAERFDGVRRLVDLIGAHVISPAQYVGAA